MNHPGLHITLLVSLLGLGLAVQGARAAVPAPAERYIVEPVTDRPASTAEAGFSEAELDQLLAPIALYPDALLSQVLIAATYPLEIVSAARWSRDHPELEGEDAVAAVAERDWDPSVKALVAFPDLLARLDQDLEWTRNLGDAVLLQEQDVMDSIQFLRARADANGSLENTEYARVIREEKTIIIEPTTTRVVHVPYYDPLVVYGGWWRPAYPPVVWAPPAHYYYGHPGFYWGSGIRISSGFFFSSFYWPQRSVVIVRTPRYYYPSRFKHARPYYTPGKRWVHNPSHRRGVHYRHDKVRERYVHPRTNDRYEDHRRGRELYTHQPDPRRGTELRTPRPDPPSGTGLRTPRPDQQRELLKSLRSEARPVGATPRGGGGRPESVRGADLKRVQSTNRLESSTARPVNRGRGEVTGPVQSNRSQVAPSSRAPSNRSQVTPSSRVQSNRVLSTREPSGRAPSTRAPSVNRPPAVNRAPVTTRTQPAPRVQRAPTVQSGRAAPAQRASRPPQARQAPSVNRPSSRPAPAAARSQPRAPRAGAQSSGRGRTGQKER
ncbi:DUF3300 domain-containing protein [Wenzhouxiangella sp. XN24]|uniref:DUF3300 domain-containing protein n=1 Tax=Wenzhouxiangella sp. XN24 TaxID=2713569 RepID=UPI0013ED5074|nr:DUF3300 domain-containing protein [Wenzhouxiangella sp. XN24]NGX15425.1 DUF3300 domain-containing protein [Wenzhouxiangella sp. XN24]